MQRALGIGLAALLMLTTTTAQAISWLASYRGNAPEAAFTVKGCQVLGVIPEVQVMAVDCGSQDIHRVVRGIKNVDGLAPNLELSAIDPEVEDNAVTVEGVGNPPTSGDADFFLDLQWGHDAVNAPEAWAVGARGEGVRVAVLDTGIWYQHPDLYANVNRDLSYSFVRGEGPFVANATSSHGTHVAGTIAGVDNSYGSVGIAPDAELVSVKVLSEVTGSGSFFAIINGIIYAALIDADVINMSLGGWMPRFTNDLYGERITADEFNAIIVLMNRAVTFATQQGTTVLAAAGNDSWNRDFDPGWMHLPADCTNAITIAATGPLGWGLDPSTNLDVPAYYTNYGQRAIDFAAPGGNVDFSLLPEDGPLPYCRVAGIVRPCYVFDLVFSTDVGGWSWKAGTSMATPHAAGVAALIIGANGGDMAPAQVKAALLQAADDLGQPGNDDWYGLGRLNALPAVQ